jgi:hypothetical protein
MPLVRAAAACLTLFALLALVGAASASARDFADGTAQGDIGRVSFSAHGGPSPFEPVSGHFHAKGEVVPGVAGEFDLEGPVTCLHVMGNRAGLFYPVRDPDPPEPNGVFVFLEDNGESAGGDTPDMIGFVPVAGPIEEPLFCPPGPTPFELTHGNITIHDDG